MDRDGARALTVQVPLGRALDIKPGQGDSITASLLVVIARGECWRLSKKGGYDPVPRGVSGLGEIAMT